MNEVMVSTNRRDVYQSYLGVRSRKKREASFLGLFCFGQIDMIECMC